MVDFSVALESFEAITLGDFSAAFALLNIRSAELDTNTWHPGSAVDLRRNDKSGSPLVKNRTRSSVPELMD